MNLHDKEKKKTKPKEKKTGEDAPQRKKLQKNSIA